MSTAIRAGQSSVDIGRALEALTAEMSQMCRLIEERVPPPPRQMRLHPRQPKRSRATATR